jgi:hypothetical protein
VLDVYINFPVNNNVTYLFRRSIPQAQNEGVSAGGRYLHFKNFRAALCALEYLNMGTGYILVMLKVLSYTALFVLGKSMTKIVPQADSGSSGAGKVLTTGQTATGDSLEQNVQFNDAHPGFQDTRGVTTDPLRSSLIDPMTTLQNFFLRPIKIQEIQWDIATGPAYVFNPWQLYFEDPRVINRISNYKLMKANLHVKFLINGNAFYYGRVLVSYRPLHNLDNTTVLIPTNFSDLVEASQRPHIWLNPTMSQGGEMILPFFTPLNMLDIPTQEWRTMGLIEVATPVVLEHANGATAPITISVFAWADNVEFTGLTQQNPTNIVPQAMSEYSGIVSKPASVVAKTAGLFKSVPYIGGFARATEIGASAISSMAALFGYSKPVAEDIPPRQPISRQSMANCDGRESLIKLTVDPCQELSIDPKIASLEMPDELTINSISNRESLLTKFDWAVGVAPESLLFNIIVDPCVIRQDGTGVNAPMHMPAVAFATFPFEYWKGTLRYRFQVVASGFHKGRLKVVYDPYGTPLSGTAEYNVAYTEVIDIAECNDFAIDVGWGQNTPWRQHLNFPQLPLSTFDGANGAVPAFPLGLVSSNIIGVGNGSLAVYVVNELTVPDSTIPNDVEILVSVSACDDFELAAPTDFYLKRLALAPITTPPAQAMQLDIKPQAGDEDIIGMENPVVDPGSLRFMGSKTVVDPIINRIHMGETVASYRQLLKRYVLHEVLQPYTTTPDGVICRFQRKMFPFFGGYTLDTPADSNLIVSTASGNYIYANMTLLNYLVRAYGAWRGGIRYTVDSTFNAAFDGEFIRPSQTVHHTTWQFSRRGNIAEDTLANNVDDDLDVASLGFSTIPADNRYIGISMQTGMLAGGSRWNTVVNPLHSFEVPYYSKYRFAPGRQGTLWSFKDLYQDNFDLSCFTVATVGADVSSVYVAAAEDFTMMFYLSPPIFYSQSPPEP